MGCTLVDMHWTAKDVVRFRKSLSLTQAEFAERLGTNQSTLSKIENGKGEIWPMLAALLTCMKESQPQKEKK